MKRTLLIARTFVPLLLMLTNIAGHCTESPGTIRLQAEEGHKLAARVNFNGHAAWFMFDTGAGAHTLARWFTEVADIAADAGHGDTIHARDSVGQVVEIQVVRDLTGLLDDGGSLELESAIVADFPPVLEEQQIGGLLNPQLLAGPDRAAVLDLRVPELRFEPFDAAGRRLGARVVDGDRIRRCAQQDEAVANLLYAFRVTAGDDRSGWLQVDSGAGRTSIAASSKLVSGVELQPGGETMGIGGQRHSYSVAPDLALSFGAAGATVDAEVVDKSPGGCGPDGLLGRDALDSCALVLDRQSVAIACN